jgi:hypothetical protein
VEVLQAGAKQISLWENAILYGKAIDINQCEQLGNEGKYILLLVTYGGLLWTLW